jgi:hypothetical protein
MLLRMEHWTLREAAEIGSALNAPSISDGEWVSDTMEDVNMGTKSRENSGFKALTEGSDVCAGTEEELLEVGKVSQTKGSVLGFAADPGADDFRLSG